MTPDAFFDNFASLADAPNAVQKLRELILQLAVQGKLVSQGPEDEPASVLLDLVKAKKRNLTEEGKIRSSNSLPVLKEDSILQSLPLSWAKVYLGECIDLISGQHLLPEDQNGAGEGLPYLTGPADFGKLYPVATRWTNVRKSIAIKNDILVTVKGAGVGKSNILGMNEAAIGRQLMAIRPIEINYEYVYLLVQAFYEHFQNVSLGSTVPGIGREDIVLFPFGLPPLAEQHRIVAKVDQLMALCDELEAKQQQQSAARERLGNTLIDKLLIVHEPAEFDEHWQRICEHFNLLYDIPETISKLRQTILQLAVQGKLVPQDPEDESAAELLKQIQKHKGELAKSNGTERSSAIRGLTHDEGPFTIPCGWVWVRFGSIIISRDGERIPVSKEERAGRGKIYDYYGASGVIDKINDYLFDKPLLLIGEDGANLINRSTPIAFIARGKYWVNNHAHVLDGISEGFLRYIELHINAIDLKPYVTGTAQPKMNQAKMNSIPVALPPLAEQHRIVAKVDQLMAFCDELEAKLKQAQAGSEKLATAMARSLLAA